MDWSQAEAVRLSSLKASIKTISLRLPVALLERIKLEANDDVRPIAALFANGKRGAAAPAVRVVHLPKAA